MAHSAANSKDDDQEAEAVFRKTLEVFKRKFSARSLAMFAVVSSRDVKYEIIRIQRDQERLKALMNLRRLQMFILRLEELQATMDSFLNAGSYLSYVWGVMQFLLSIASSTLSDGFDSLLGAYERLGQNMPILRDRNGLFTQRTGMRGCLTALYRDILDFHAGAYQCFTQFHHEKGRKKIFKSAWKDFDHEISYLGDNILAHKTLVDLGGRLLDGQGTNGHEAGLSTNDIRVLSTEVSRYELDILKRDRKRKDAERERRHKEFQAALKWVSAGLEDQLEKHEERRDVRRKYPNTCDWIKKSDAVYDWMNADAPDQSILWINGSVGAGKSTLASYLIDQCIEGTSVGVPFKTIYFYCHASVAQSSTFLDICRGLLHQQLMQIREIEEFKHLIAYCFDKKSGSGQQQLNNDDAARSLLDLFFDIIPCQYIIIDGLDECSKPDMKLSLSLLNSVVARQDGRQANAKAGSLRLLIVSRDTPEIRRHLSADAITANTNIVKIEVRDNEDAILKYVDRRMTEFHSNICLSKEELEQIRDNICNRAKGAQGMFLFAELVLNNLQQCSTKEILMQELDVRRFPGTLSAAYDRIIAGIRQNQNPRSWEKTKAIFGWLICAGRILRWHEIQAIVSIEKHDQSVEFQQKKFIPDVEELCGTLVHVKPGNKVELIHHTAHEYILKYVNKVEVQFYLATLCMQYLTFPCFERGITAPVRKKYAQNGFYAFQDYAVSKWFYHIAEVVKISPSLFSIDEAKSEKFAKILDDFTHRYQESIEDQGSTENGEHHSSLSASKTISSRDVEEIAKKECESLKDAIFHPMLLNLWIHISKHEKENIENRNKPSLKEMEKTLTENRKIIERLVDNARGDEADALTEYYGKNVFKCPRTHCDYFYEGFEIEKKREHHINRHDRPYECTVPNCGIAAAGFISSKDLERHKRNYHTGLVEGPAAFPQLNKKKNTDARFDCKVCGQRFTRKINLTGHTRSHFGERPFGCQNCGKKFTRVNDLRRHEKIHLRK